MLRIAIPNKGALSEPAQEMLKEAGYRSRSDHKDLTVVDSSNGVEFFYLRPKDIAIYVGNGQLDLGITGRDLAIESQAPVRERLGLGFGASKFRYAAPANEEWTVDKIAGKTIASAYPNLTRSDLKNRGIDARVIRLDGAVEISIQLGVADCIADIVESGRALRAHGLAPFGEPLCESEAVLIERDGGADTSELTRAKDTLTGRIQGVSYAKKYLMLDYDCPRELLDKAIELSPGIQSPTVSPLSNDGWVAVRAMVPHHGINALMDELHELGASAILASDLRTCRL